MRNEVAVYLTAIAYLIFIIGVIALIGSIMTEALTIWGAVCLSPFVGVGGCVVLGIAEIINRLTEINIKLDKLYNK